MIRKGHFAQPTQPAGNPAIHFAAAPHDPLIPRPERARHNDFRSRPRSRHPARLSGACPCGLAATYDECCGRLHRGQARAVTPEQLMRSRFSAYAVHDEPYLLRTWHSATRPAVIGFDPAVHWLGLEVLDSTEPGPFGGEGIVEFRARYTHGSVPGQLHERSRFLRHDNAWTYVDGT